MNIGIRLHDTKEGNLYERLGFAKAQGFSCAHLAMSKAIRGFSMADAPKLLTEELAQQVKNDFASQGMECAVLGCYLNLANTNEEELHKTQEIYHAHLRFCRMVGAGVVFTVMRGKWTRFAALGRWLLGLGVMLASGEIPRIAGNFGLETATRPNVNMVINTAQSAVHLVKMVAK